MSWWKDGTCYAIFIGGKRDLLFLMNFCEGRVEGEDD